MHTALNHEKSFMDDNKKLSRLLREKTLNDPILSYKRGPPSFDTFVEALETRR